MAVAIGQAEFKIPPTAKNRQKVAALVGIERYLVPCAGRAVRIGFGGAMILMARIVTMLKVVERHAR